MDSLHTHRERDTHKEGRKVRKRITMATPLTTNLVDNTNAIRLLLIGVYATNSLCNEG